MRIFAGQEPSCVWVGWVTPDFHQFDPSFDLSKVRCVTVTVGDDKGNIHDRSASLVRFSFLCSSSTSCTALEEFILFMFAV